MIRQVFRESSTLAKSNLQLVHPLPSCKIDHSMVRLLLQSLFMHQAPSDCAILGASYIVFVTTSAFNILAVTINEIYHFTNKIIGVQMNNRCCVVFGLSITWFASVIINLGVAFLPGNPTFDSAVSDSMLTTHHLTTHADKGCSKSLCDSHDTCVWNKQPLCSCKGAFTFTWKLWLFSNEDESL